MLTIQEIFQLIDTDPTSTDGAFMAARLDRRERRNLRAASVDQLALLEEVQMCWPIVDLSPEHEHPAPRPDKTEDYLARPFGALTPVEREYLESISSTALIEPVLLDWADVCKLAALWAAADDNGGDDRAFVEPLWSSVNRYHRRAAIESRLDKLSRLNSYALPEKTLDAIVASLRTAQPALDPAAARKEAARLLREHLGELREERNTEQAQLEQQLHRLRRASVNG